MTPQLGIGMKEQYEYDYRNQAWLLDGKYVSCSHPAEMDCKCFGRVHSGEEAADDAELEFTMQATLIRELIEDSIAIQQDIQMRHHPDSHAWQVASAEIHRLAAMLTGKEPQDARAGAALGALRKVRKGW